jgi:predicted metal-dependent HD superfamily phosphohydrolase
MKDYIHEMIFNIIRPKDLGQNEEKIHKTVDGIIKSYNEPYRKYHTMNHIMKCIDVLHNFSYSPMLFDINDKYYGYYFNRVAIAIIYHDIVYNPISRRNESDSIKRMYDDLSFTRDGWMFPDQLRLSKMLIYATTYGESFYTKEENIIRDVDLHQLGSDFYEFLLNENNIREEYKYVPDELFYPERAKILQRFLDRKRIFKIDWFYDKYENNARENIKYVLDRMDIFSAD